MTNVEEVPPQRDLLILARGFCAAPWRGSRRAGADNNVFHSTILMETI
ncbi:MAG: hypothetical protein GQ562_10870 [Anaerolineales bacterium]|nr:hypothetical protein [Anaerolineales bacterium]